MLTTGWRALCDCHRLSHPTPCCPAYPSALPPPTQAQTHSAKRCYVTKSLSIAEQWVHFIVQCHNYATCLKFPFFLCSQSIMSWKIGIIIFRTSVCGTSVTPRKGPIIPGMKCGLLSPGLRRFIQTDQFVCTNFMDIRSTVKSLEPPFISLYFAMK